MRKQFLGLVAFSFTASALAADLGDTVRDDYDGYLAGLFDHFHRNPELSTVEFETAQRMARELRQAGFDVTENVGGTGVVAMLEKRCRTPGDDARRYGRIAGRREVRPGKRVACDANGSDYR